MPGLAPGIFLSAHSRFLLSAFELDNRARETTVGVCVDRLWNQAAVSGTRERPNLRGVVWMGGGGRWILACSALMAGLVYGGAGLQASCFARLGGFFCALKAFAHGCAGALGLAKVVARGKGFIFLAGGLAKLQYEYGLVNFVPSDTRDSSLRKFTRLLRVAIWEGKGERSLFSPLRAGKLVTPILKSPASAGLFYALIEVSLSAVLYGALRLALSGDVASMIASRATPRGTPRWWC